MISTVKNFLVHSYFFYRTIHGKTAMVSLKMGAENTACAIELYFSPKPNCSALFT